MADNPKVQEVFQAELDELIDGIVAEARPGCEETIRDRLTAPGPINDKLCALAHDRMRDRFAGMADHYRDLAKDDL